MRTVKLAPVNGVIVVLLVSGACVFDARAITPYGEAQATMDETRVASDINQLQVHPLLAHKLKKENHNG